MIERVRLGAGLALLALLPPLVMVASPALLLWAAHQRRGRRQRGRRLLWPFQERAVRALAEVLIAPEPPPGGWGEVGRGVDAYAAAIRDGRAWQVPLLLTALELAPLATVRPPFSRMSPSGRRRFLRRHVHRPGSLFAPLGWSRQMARMGYHGAPGIAAAAGYVPFEGRRRPVRRAASRRRVGVAS